MDNVGQQIGNYRLVQSLGIGAFGNVYVGKHIYLETLAAIKMFRLFGADRERERFYMRLE